MKRLVRMMIAAAIAGLVFAGGTEIVSAQGVSPEGATAPLSEIAKGVVSVEFAGDGLVIETAEGRPIEVSLDLGGLGKELLGPSGSETGGLVRLGLVAWVVGLATRTLRRLIH